MKKIAGQSLTEYMILSIVIVMILTAKVYQGKSVIDLIVESIKINHAGFIFGDSLPS